MQIFKNLGVACVFVFNGLDFGKKDQRPHVQPESVRAFEQAWGLYDQQQADQVVDAFSGAGMFFSLLLSLHWGVYLLVRSACFSPAMR